MPDPTRFAGFHSPATLLRDATLTRAQKVDALHAWRAKVEHAAGVGIAGAPRADGLIAEIEQALATARAEIEDHAAISRSSEKTISQRRPSGR